jgi:hypothetical protein
MGDTSRQAHWENVYTTKGENEVSWFQQSPAPSLELIVQAGAAQVGHHRHRRRRVAAGRPSRSSRGLRMSRVLDLSARR